MLMSFRVMLEGTDATAAQALAECLRGWVGSDAAKAIVGGGQAGHTVTLTVEPADLDRVIDRLHTTPPPQLYRGMVQGRDGSVEMIQGPAYQTHRNTLRQEPGRQAPSSATPTEALGNRQYLDDLYAQVMADTERRYSRST
jgi:hypothetical protein